MVLTERPDWGPALPDPGSAALHKGLVHTPCSQAGVQEGLKTRLEAPEEGREEEKDGGDGTLAGPLCIFVYI